MLRRSLAPLCAAFAFSLLLGCGDKKKRHTDDAEIRPDPVVASASASTSAEPIDPSITFKYTPVEIGERKQESWTSRTETITNRGGQQDTVVETEASRVIYEVLATKDGVTARERLVYDQFEEKIGPLLKPTPETLGKPYEVFLRDGVLDAVHTDGTPASPSEVSWIDGRWGLGRKEWMADVFDGQTVRPGETVPPLVAKLKGLLGLDSPSVNVKSERCTFEGREGRDAKFVYRFEHEVRGIAKAMVATSGTLYVSIPRGAFVQEERKTSYRSDDGQTRIESVTNHARMSLPPAAGARSAPR
ncbi:MAG: hypothetical protein HOW73_29615 [Polyangiaceae bacterium]|nr:hypothetical protein [Polyangiaceae bacterium]